MLDLQQTVSLPAFINQQTLQMCWLSVENEAIILVSEKMDRRKKYTRMVLKQSLMKLLKCKHISSITVKEICELADINRSTFYAHYSDHYALLEQLEDELVEDMIVYLGQYDSQKEDEAFQMTVKIIEYFASKHEECQTLLSDNSNSSFEQKVRQVASRYMMQHWPGVLKLEDEMTAYIGAFIISGSIEVMKVWLDNEMDKSPKEIAGVIINIINYGVLGVNL